MTLKERFVGGNPQVLLLLFCLFCVILICFVGTCPNMMQKSENILKPLTGKLGMAMPDLFPLKPDFFFLLLPSFKQHNLFDLSTFLSKPP